MIRRDLKTAGIKLPPKMDLVVFIKPYAIEWLLYTYIRDHPVWKDKSVKASGLMRVDALKSTLRGWIQTCYYF